jgi:hypothetical protein
LTEAFQKRKFDAYNQIVCAPIRSLTSRQDKHSPSKLFRTILFNWLQQQQHATNQFPLMQLKSTPAFSVLLYTPKYDMHFSGHY